MAIKPILFSGPMVRALLAGTKAQTRRILKPQYENYFKGADGVWRYTHDAVAQPTFSAPLKLPYAVGDRLYVREHWKTFTSLDGITPRNLWAPDAGRPEAGVRYEADGAGMVVSEGRVPSFSVHYDPKAFGKHRQAMHMPRWASRLTLTVTDVRVERLQGISEEDAIAEGIECVDQPDGDFRGSWGMYGDEPPGGGAWSDPRRSYRSLWDQINDKDSPAAWFLNPWVAAYTFTVHHGNIDQLEAA